MRRRLLRSTALIALAAVLVLGVPLAIVGSALLRQRADSRLERRADEIALRLVRAEAVGTPLTTALVRDLLSRDQAVRFTRDGTTTVFGTPPTGPVTQIRSGDGGSLAVTLVAPAADRNDDVGIVWLAVGGCALAAVMAAAMLAGVQARRLSRPLEELAGRVGSVGHEDYDDRPIAGSVPEVDDVHAALNQADERISDLVRREREFTANVSHQLRSPLTGLRLRLEELQRIAADDDGRAEAEAALAQADRLVATIEHLETTARVRDDRPPALDVSAVVTEHLEREGWAARYAAAGRDLHVDVAPAVVAHVHPETVHQVGDVLLENALAHGSGAVTVVVRGGDGGPLLRVADEGARAALPPSGQLFARGVGDHTGLGLAVARELLRAVGGDLRVDPAAARTTFVATFAGREPDA